MKQMLAAGVLIGGLTLAGASQAAPATAAQGLKAPPSGVTLVRRGGGHGGGHFGRGGGAFRGGHIGGFRGGHIGRFRGGHIRSFRGARIGGWRGGRHWRGGRWGGLGWWGPTIGIGLYDGYYYSGCRWLYRKAVRTGSPYWWRRYRHCRGW